MRPPARSEMELDVDEATCQLDLTVGGAEAAFAQGSAELDSLGAALLGTQSAEGTARAVLDQVLHQRSSTWTM